MSTRRMLAILLLLIANLAGAQSWFQTGQDVDPPDGIPTAEVLDSVAVTVE